MRKLFPITIIAVFAALSFSSCKKDHTCTCKVHVPATNDTSGGTVTVTSPAFDTTIRYDLGKQSSSDAKSSCSTDQTNINSQLSLLTDSATVNCGI